MASRNVEIKKSELHLGVLLAADCKICEKYFCERVASAKSICYAIKSLGSRSAPL